MTVEEHNIVGGIGSIVSEALAGTMKHPKLVRMGTTDDNHRVGNYSYMMEKNGLSAKAISMRVESIFSKMDL